MKIKGQGKVIKYLSGKIAASNRKKFSVAINRNLDTIISKCHNGKRINIELVSFSSSRDFEEQIISILSFLKFVGEPDKWTIYSDGSHTQVNSMILGKFPFVNLINDKSFTPAKSINN